MMRGYDEWLERPYQRAYGAEPPAAVEDLLGTVFWLDGERAEVVSYEQWEDADEDGRYGGCDLIVKVGRFERNMRPDEVRLAIASPDEHRPDDD